MTIRNEEISTSTQFQSKRLLYVRSVTRLLRACGSKYQQLLTTDEGLKAFRSSVAALLTMINDVMDECKWLMILI